jgi:Skp family chaperone for outer membrane proteins
MKFFKLIVAFILFSFSGPVLGSETASFYTVDMNKLLKQTVVGKKLISANNSLRQSLQNENDALEAELLIEEKDLSELRGSLSADEFRPKALAFDQKVTIIRLEQAQKEENLLRNIRKKESDFYKNIYPLLYKLLSEHGGLILLDQRNVVLWDSSVDITDEAIDMINRIYGDQK